MIRYLGQEEKEKSRDLWREAFPEDSEGFLDYYYTEKTRDNRILVIETRGQLLAMLHRNPYLISAGKRLWKCDYLVGVATARHSRRKGYMRQLMERALEDMQEEGMPFCFLMPAFRELYLPFGFTDIFHKQEWKLKESSVENLEKKIFKTEASQMTAQWMNEWLKRNYEVYTLRSQFCLERLEKEIRSEKGYTELFYSGTELAGVRAEWGLTEKEQRMLLCEPEYRENIGFQGQCIMGRILDLTEFVRAVCLEEKAEEEELTVFLQIEDRQLLKNTGVWRWHLNKNTSFIEKKGTISNAEMPDLRLDITELTAWLLGYCVPEKIGKYAEKIRTLKGVFLDEIV